MDTASRPVGSAGDVRASDQERERVVVLLRDHTSVGRLTAEELEERIGAAYAARTRGELSQLLADLPRDDRGVAYSAVAAPRRPTFEPRPRRRRRGRARRRGLTAVLLVALIAAASGSDGPDDEALTPAGTRAVAAAERAVPGGRMREVEEEADGWWVTVEGRDGDRRDVFVDRRTGRVSVDD